MVSGDSFVHGACVKSPQTLPSRISKRTGVEALNLGFGGNNPSHYLTYSELFIPKVKPKRVFLVFYPNDVGVQKNSAIENMYVREERQLFSSDRLELFDIQMFINNGRKVVASNLQNRDLEKYDIGRWGKVLKRHARLPAISSLLPKNDERWFAQTRRAIVATRDLCDDYNCEVTMLFIPNSKFYRPDSRADVYAELIEELSASINLRFIDGRDVIDRPKGSSDFAIKGIHLSPKGYEKIAQLVYHDL